MRKKYCTLILLCLCTFGVSAQTLEEAKKMFENKEFTLAKETFKKYAIMNPANPSYNFWYGACCYETGEKKLAEKYLVIAANKKIQESFRYLGQLCSEQYRYQAASNYYNTYISMLTKAKKPTEEFEKQLKKVTLATQMMKGVEQVTIIDSLIVDKTRFLSAYKINEESGKLFTYKDYFQTESEHEGTVYQTELGNKIYYADKSTNGQLSIFTKTKLIDQWSEGTLLPKSINAGADTNYPFVMSDGITIYYASKGEGSIGGYDIFVTRYSSESNTYLNPENVGMPFNSPFNDYMYVVDEYNNLGWFASDRYQPKDKVCIYVFIPNESKHTYDINSIEENKLISLAKISSLKDTWRDKEVKSAKERLIQASNYQPTEQKQNDFEIIINDQSTYHNAKEFGSVKAIELLNNWLQLTKEYNALNKKLEEQRDAYNEGNEAKKGSLTPEIINLERSVEQMSEKLNALEIQIRNEENNWLHK